MEIEEGTVEEALTFGRLFPVYFLEKFVFKGKKEDINRFYETSSGAGSVIRYIKLNLIWYGCRKQVEFKQRI